MPLFNKREKYAAKLRKENRLNNIKKKRAAALLPENNLKLKESREILVKCGLVLADYTSEVMLYYTLIGK